MVLTGDESLYCFDLKIKVERKIVKKIVSGKWTSVANAGEVLTGWKVAKTWPSSAVDAIAWKDFVFDREDEFAASERPLSRGENFDDDIP